MKARIARKAFELLEQLKRLSGDPGFHFIDKLPLSVAFGMRAAHSRAVRPRASSLRGSPLPGFMAWCLWCGTRHGFLLCACPTKNQSGEGPILLLSMDVVNSKLLTLLGRFYGSPNKPNIMITNGN